MVSIAKLGGVCSSSITVCEVESYHTCLVHAPFLQVAEDASSGGEQFDLFQQLGKGIIERLDNKYVNEEKA